MDQCITPEGYKLCPELQKQVDGVSNRKTMRNLKETVSEIDKPLERIYKLKPHWRPNAGFETREMRPFNYDICDDECDKEREREEFEAHL